MPPLRTPDGQPNSCPVCGNAITVEPSWPPGDAPCPKCGQLVWYPAVAGMLDLDFIVGGGVVYEIPASSKLEAIEYLVNKLRELGFLQSRFVDGVVQAIVHREELGPTGIGRGIAIPHAKHEAVQQVVAIGGFITAGIDFDSLDGEPVNRVFLLLSPPSEPGEHLCALERISRALRSGE